MIDTLVDVSGLRLRAEYTPATDRANGALLLTTINNDTIRGSRDERLETAVHWVLESDAAAFGILAAGGVITKKIPRTDPVPIPSLPPTAGPHEYRRLRPQVGQFIRPLLLPPRDLTALFQYQRDGVRWLINHTRGILADDMGLGKTPQAILAAASLLSAGEVKTTLVLCPRGLLANWEDELTRWTPDLSRMRVIPSGHNRDAVFNVVLGRVHVLITTYEQVRNPPASLTRRIVDLIIADEAHRVRNLTAGVTQGLRSLQWKRFWALTGTPIERHPSDFLTLLGTLEPSRFSVDDVNLPVGTIRTRAQPYLLRRLKSEVLSELPPVIDALETLELLPVQRRAYERAYRDPQFASGGDKGFLSLLTELRRICDYDPTSGLSCKADRIRDIASTVKDADEKLVVFSYLLRPLSILSELLSEAGIGSVTLRGEMGVDERRDVVDSFRNLEDVTVLLASSRVGGEGLTLTEANNVAFFNEWWNPSANAQARDRVVRIGQKRGVIVHRFRCKDTIEETLDRILRRKDDATFSILDRLATAAPDDADVRQMLSELRRTVESGGAKSGVDG